LIETDQHTKPLQNHIGFEIQSLTVTDMNGFVLICSSFLFFILFFYFTVSMN